MLFRSDDELIKENNLLKQYVEEAKKYIDDANQRVHKYEEELQRKNKELASLQSEMQTKASMKYVTPETQHKMEKVELNMLKLEKLKHLAEIGGISESEYNRLKDRFLEEL